MSLHEHKVKAWLLPGAICLVSFLLIRNFFEFFPNGWDQAEYAWCIQKNYLPHSPYILHFILGKLFYWMVGDAAWALSALSLCAGIASLVLLYRLALLLFKPDGEASPGQWNPERVAVSAIFLMGTNYLFVRQAGTQEVYILQLFFLLLAAQFILGHNHGHAALGGMAYGCAIATHSGSIFLFPAIALLVVMSARSRKRAWGRALFGMCLFATLGTAGFCALIYVLLPRSADGNQWAYYVSYLRGIAPGFDSANLWKPSFLLDSVGDLFHRLTSPDIREGRGPAESFPVGMAAFQLILALAGLIVTWRRRWKLAVFWLLWCAPYLGYELLRGSTPDFGVYVVFVLPCVMSLAGVAICWCVDWVIALGKALPDFTAPVLLTVTVLLAARPSLAQLKQHWHDVERDTVEHFDARRLAAIGASAILPLDAVLIQPGKEWNVNLFPYYAERRHVQRRGPGFYIFKDIGRFAPMNAASYDFFTAPDLAALIKSGIPVYAFESDPLFRWVEKAQHAFLWTKDKSVNLDTVKASLGLPDAVLRQLPQGEFILYRGSTDRLPW